VGRASIAGDVPEGATVTVDIDDDGEWSIQIA